MYADGEFGLMIALHMYDPVSDDVNDSSVATIVSRCSNTSKVVITEISAPFFSIPSGPLHMLDMSTGVSTASFTAILHVRVNCEVV